MSWKCFWIGLIVCVFFKYHSFFSSKNFFRTSGEPGGWLISTLHLRFSFFWGTSHFAVRLLDCLSCSQFRIQSQAWMFLRESFSFSQTGFRISKCKCLIQCFSFITKYKNVYYRIQNGNNIKYLFFFCGKSFFFSRDSFRLSCISQKLGKISTEAWTHGFSIMSNVLEFNHHLRSIMDWPLRIKMWMNAYLTSSMRSKFLIP